MAKVTLGGVDYEIAPYRIRQYRQAAPYFDKIQAKAREFAGMNPIELADKFSVSELLDVIEPAVGFILPGMRLTLSRPDLTLDELMDMVSIQEGLKLQDAVGVICVESGLSSGEAKPVSPAP